MPTYRQADRDDVELLAEVMREYHPKLTDAGVRVGLLHAMAARDKEGMPKGPALTHHGYPALAVVKINSLKDRVEGKPDATITLDGERWGEQSREEKVALLHHEILHLVVATDEDGGVKTDDAFRPVLKMRMHDYEAGGFWEVVDKHGKHAPESKSYREIHREFSQRVFPWG